MERWKDIPGYEGLYQASTEGRIRSAPGKTTSNARYKSRVWKTRIMKGRGDNPKTGKRVNLWKDGKRKEWLVARLVAMTWVPGFKDGMTVNHINGNRMDNRVCNLEWLSLADNILHGFETGLYSRNQKRVLLLDHRSGKQKSFNSMAEASRFLGKGNGFISSRIGKGQLRINNIEITP
jgi:hypothetical protein